MPRTIFFRIIIITAILIAFFAVASNAKWGSQFGPFTTNDAATVHAEANEIVDGKVPDGLSASDWNGIRAAHDAARGSSTEGFSQDSYLKPAAIGTTQTVDELGYSVSVSGDTVVVGAPLEDSGSTGVNSTPNESAVNSGAAYVFIRVGLTWVQQAYLKPAAVGTTQAQDGFGYSVCVSLDTIVVGAPFEDSSALGVNSTPNENSNNSGAAYVFVRSGGVWAQQAYLKPAAVGTTQAGDWFGYSVAVSGDTVVIGARFEDSNTTGVNSTPNDTGGSQFDSGAAYVFTRNAGIWAQQAYLKPAIVGTTQAGDQFGTSVGVSGDTVVVGADSEDSGTTGVNSMPDESANSAGAAYVFTRSGSVWMQQAYLKPAAVGTTQAVDLFGASVAVSGETVVVGSPGEDSGTIGVNSTPNESSTQAGAAYVFVRNAGMWTQEAYLKPAAVGSTQAGDEFGHAVGISGDTVVIGAVYEDSSTTGVNSFPNENSVGSGAAFVFTRNAGVWAQQAYLKPSAVGSTQAGDQFGWAVGISGGTVVIGADDEDSSTTGVNSTPNESSTDSGAAYVFGGLGPASLVVNEIDYDQPGATDAAEFIELKNVSGAAINLDPVTVELINGAACCTPYLTIDLPNVSLPAGGYYVICGDSAAVANCDMIMSTGTNFIQNGAPDAVGVRVSGGLVDAVSYEGNTGGPYTEGSGAGLIDDGLSDAVGISRNPDGVDTNVNNVDFSPHCVTPGMANTSANTGCVAVSPTPTNSATASPTPTATVAPTPGAVVINEIDYDQGGGVDTGEFIELKNVSSDPINLDPFTVELARDLFGFVYQTIDLPNVNLPAGGYYVICANASTVLNCDLDVTPNTDLIDDGPPPAAVGLRYNGTIFDAVSYEGNTGAPYTEGSGFGLTDDGFTAFAGISRFPDGADTDQNNVDLSPRCITPGRANDSASTSCSAPSNTPTNTPTDTPTPANTPSISGVITYGNAIGNPVPPRLVKNVSVASVSGSPPVGPVITGTPGTYTLTGFGAGSYTIKPTKPGGTNPAITSNDAARVAQGVSGSVPFVSLNQKFASDASGNGTVSSNDAALIARFAAGLTGTGNVGQWKFFTANLSGLPTAPLPTPPYNDSRTYASVTSNATGEDYIALLIGEASGNYNPSTHPRGTVVGGQMSDVSGDGGGPERGIEVKLSQAVTVADKDIVIPVSVQGVADKEIISYEFDLRYDPLVIQPSTDAVDVKGTASRWLSVVVNATEPGLLRVVVYGAYPINSNGLLLNLKFTAAGAQGSVSPLTWDRILFNDGEPSVTVTDGRVELY